MICYGPVTHDIKRLSGLANAPCLPQNWRRNPICMPFACRHIPWVKIKPELDLILSPQHRLCLSSNIVERITGEHQALISAKDLLELDGFDVVEGDAPTTYYHVMTPEQQLIMANGCLGEKLFTGPQALRMIPAESRREFTRPVP